MADEAKVRQLLADALRRKGMRDAQEQAQAMLEAEERAAAFQQEIGQRLDAYAQEIIAWMGQDVFDALGIQIEYSFPNQTMTPATINAINNIREQAVWEYRGYRFQLVHPADADNRWILVWEMMGDFGEKRRPGESAIIEFQSPEQTRDAILLKMLNAVQQG